MTTQFIWFFVFVCQIKKTFRWWTVLIGGHMMDIYMHIKIDKWTVCHMIDNSDSDKTGPMHTMTKHYCQRLNEYT